MLNFFLELRIRKSFVEVIMKKDYSKLWVLFKSMFVLSACTFGGGFVIVSLMKKKYVEELDRISHEEKICRRTPVVRRR